MQPYLPILKACHLFQNMQDKDITDLAHCLNLSIRNYQADSYIFLLDHQVNSIGIVLDGEVEIAKESIIGGTHIIAIIRPAEIFAEGIVCTASRRAPVTARTRVTSTICFLPFERLLKTCGNSCSFHTQLIYNLMLILAEKNAFLNHKMDLLSIKGMREKLVTYLLMQSKQIGQLHFELPFNRNELAAYLNVSRTSMCRELGRMKEEGLIDYHLNRIRILDLDALTACLEN